jgi:hypothetical protein
MKIILWTFGFIIIIVIALAIADVASTPSPQRTQCVLQRKYVLPDTCVSGCPAFPNCTATTRPYLIFFTQSATCLDAIICGGG